MKQTYKIKYKIIPGSFVMEHAGPLEGLTDALLFASVVRDAEGNTSTVWVTRDGDGPMSVGTQFVQWGILANHLLKEGLPLEQARICSDALEAMRAMVKK